MSRVAPSRHKGFNFCAFLLSEDTWPLIKEELKSYLPSEFTVLTLALFKQTTSVFAKIMACGQFCAASKLRMVFISLNGWEHKGELYSQAHEE